MPGWQMGRVSSLGLGLLHLPRKCPLGGRLRGRGKTKDGQSSPSLRKVVPAWLVLELGTILFKVLHFIDPAEIF